MKILSPNSTKILFIVLWVKVESGSAIVKEKPGEAKTKIWYCDL